MIIENDIKLDFDDVLMVPQRSTLESRKEVILEKEYRFYHSPRSLMCLPIIASNMVQTGCFNMANELYKHNMLCSLHKYYNNKQLRDFYKDIVYENDRVFVSIGMKDEELLRIRAICDRFPDIVIDVPNGHIEKFTRFCSKVRNEFRDSIIMAGNVCIPEMVQELIVHGGVDIVKVGIGPGKFCETRMVTGCGYPSFSSTVSCAQVAHGLKSGEKRMGLVCIDGGFRQPGDLAKAFGAGADFCMTSSIFAGTEECEGEWKLLGGVRYKYYPIESGFEEDEIVNYPTHNKDLCSKYEEIVTHNKSIDGTWRKPPQKISLLMYGMSSHLAQKLHGEGKKEYRASEGSVREIKCKGPVKDTIQEICGGLRSAATYIGATCLKDFPKCSKFIRVNRIHTDG